MARSRRDVLKASAALAAPLVLTGRARAADVMGAFDPVTYFERRDYEIKEPHPLITGEAFNGGLRYDELPGHEDGAKFVRLQSCARLDDIPRLGEPGVLPFFRILGYRNMQPAYPGETISDVLEYLIDGAALNPHRLVVVSTDRIMPLQHLLENHDIGPHQVVLRDWEAARADGGGSGYFAPPGHPHAPGHASASLHYPLSKDVSNDDLSYPLADHIEVAELLLFRDGEDTVTTEYGALGLDRIAMARGEATVDPGDARLALLTVLEDEADERGVPLPEGYHAFRTL